MLEALFSGIGGADVAMAVNRIGVGMFFMITGGFKLLKSSWRANLADTLRQNHIPFVKFNTWWVPSVEFAAGSACVIGLLAPLAAFGLLVIMMVAMSTDVPRKVAELKPAGEIELIDDW